jgi:myo-inositol-1(or 4)-monophosphatase
MGLPLPEVHERRELERIAVDVAREAARLVVEERPEHLQVARTKSSATDIVTEMDQRAQDLIRERLGRARPQDGFLGE